MTAKRSPATPRRTPLSVYDAEAFEHPAQRHYTVNRLCRQIAGGSLDQDSPRYTPTRRTSYTTPPGRGRAEESPALGRSGSRNADASPKLRGPRSLTRRGGSQETPALERSQYFTPSTSTPAQPSRKILPHCVLQEPITLFSRQRIDVRGVEGRVTITHEIFIYSAGSAHIHDDPAAMDATVLKLGNGCVNNSTLGDSGKDIVQTGQEAKVGDKLVYLKRVTHVLRGGARHKYSKNDSREYSNICPGRIAQVRCSQGELQTLGISCSHRVERQVSGEIRESENVILHFGDDSDGDVEFDPQVMATSNGPATTCRYGETVRVGTGHIEVRRLTYFKPPRKSLSAELCNSHLTEDRFYRRPAAIEIEEQEAATRTANRDYGIREQNETEDLPDDTLHDVSSLSRVNSEPPESVRSPISRNHSPVAGEDIKNNDYITQARRHIQELAPIPLLRSLSEQQLCVDQRGSVIPSPLPMTSYDFSAHSNSYAGLPGDDQQCVEQEAPPPFPVNLNLDITRASSPVSSSRIHRHQRMITLNLMINGVPASVNMHTSVRTFEPELDLQIVQILVDNNLIWEHPSLR